MKKKEQLFIDFGNWHYEYDEPIKRIRLRKGLFLKEMEIEFIVNKKRGEDR